MGVCSFCPKIPAPGGAAAAGFSRGKPEKLHEVDTHMGKEWPEDVCSKGGRWGIAGCGGFSGPKEWADSKQNKTYGSSEWHKGSHPWKEGTTHFTVQDTIKGSRFWQK